LSALCISCETADDVFATETNNPTNTLHHAKGVEVNDYQMYQSILNSFVYNNQQPHQENLLRFEQHVNRQILNYVPQETYKYEKLNTEQLLVLEQAGTDFIEQLVYTNETKQAIYAILSNTFNSETTRLIPNESESRLTETLFALHSNGDDDILWNGKRSIAFAYGAQSGFTQAVLYAGAIELLAKQQ